MKKLRHKCKVTLSLFVTMLLVIGSVTASLATDENSSAKAYSATLTEDQITLTLNAVVNGDLPDDTKLTVKKVTSNESEYKGLEKKLSNQATEDHYINNGSSIYDYAFVSENKEVTPTGDVTLTMTYSQAYAPSGATNEDEVSLFKLSSPVVNLAKDTKTKITTANQSNKVTQISYTTNSLDPIALVYREKKQSVSKVNVHYVNAKDTSKELADVKTISGSELSGEMSLDNLSKALVNTDNYTYTYQKAALDKANGTTIQGLKADKKDDVTKLYYITSGSKDYTTYKGEGESYEVNIYLLYDVTEKVKEDTSKKEETSKTEATTSETKVAEEASKSESTTSKTKATEETQKSTVSENNKKTEEQKVEMPAASFTASTSKLKISVTASENTFPKGTTMKAKEISASTAKSIAKEKMKDVKNAIGADITFYYQGKEIEPANNKNVTVKMEPKNTLDEKHFNVLHKKDSGEVEKIDAEVKDKKFVFKAKSFSIYIIGEKTVYTYKFHKDSTANSNVIEEYTQKITNGDKLDQPKAPEKEGYKFIGWATTPNATKADITDDYFSNPIDTTKITTEDANNVVNIYPVFQEVHYVFFMAGNKGEDANKVAYTMERTSGEEINADDMSKVHLGLASNQAIEGWYTDSNLSADSKVTSIKIENKNIKVYPKIVTGYYITYESNGGTYYAPKFVAGGNKPTGDEYNPTPSKKGYKFKCWSKQQNGSASYNFNQTLDENLTLYAVYTPVGTNYTVIVWQQSLDDKYYYGTDGQPAKTYKVGMTVELKGITGSTVDVAAAKEKFEGEYKRGFNYNEDKSNADISKHSSISGDGKTVVNIYYDRKVVTFNFNYPEDSIENLNNGNQPIVQKGLYGQDIDFTWPKEYTKAKYHFEWKYNYYDYEIVKVYDTDDDGNYIADGTEKINWYSDDTKKIVTFISAYISPESDREVDNFTTTSSGNASFIFYKQNLDGTYDSDHMDISYAGNGSYYINDKYNGFTPDQYRTLKTNKNGYSYWSDWKDAKDRNGNYVVVPSGYSRLEILFKRNSYQLTFFNYDKQFKQENVLYQQSLSSYNYENNNEYKPSIPDSLKDDQDAYTFEGWYETKDCSGDPFDFSQKMPAHGITLYAKWTSKKVKATVHDIDSNSEKIIEDNMDYRSKVNTSLLPIVKDQNGNTVEEGTNDYSYTVPDGSKWIGWATKDKGGNYILFNFDEELRDDLDLYPYVISSSKYKVWYDLDGDLKPDDAKIKDAKTYSLNANADVQHFPTDDTSSEGKMFLNWQVYDMTADGPKPTDNYLYPGDKLKMTGDKLLKAIYTPIPAKVNLTYYANNKSDGYGTKNGVTLNDIDNNSEIVLKSYDDIFTSDTVEYGYEFIGWNTQADGNGTSFAANKTVGINKIDTNVLYAQWKPKKVSLTISKDVKGNFGDKNTKYFEFTVTLTNLKKNISVSLNTDHATYYQDKNHEIPTVVSNDSGTATVSVWLKNGDSINLNDLILDNKDASYKVVEKESEYEAAYKIDEKDVTNGSSTEEEKFDLKDHTVAFTNTNNAVIPTGIEKNAVITLPLIIAGIGFVLLMLKKRNEVE